MSETTRTAASSGRSKGRLATTVSASVKKGLSVKPAAIQQHHQDTFAGKRADKLKKFFLSFSAKKAKAHPKRFTYSMFSEYPATWKIEIVKHGLPPGMVQVIAFDLGIEQGRLMDSLGLARSTTMSKIKNGKLLGLMESERVLGIAELVGQVEVMMEESGAPKGFDPRAWVGRWIDTPLPALGSRKPAEFMDTAEGQKLVSKLLAQSQSGAYA